MRPANSLMPPKQRVRQETKPLRVRPSLRERRPTSPSEEMKAWSAGLAAELTTWPEVRSRVFFGFTAFHRNEKIFALLPRTRVLEPANALAFKLERAGPRVLAEATRDSRIGFTEMQKARWFTFSLNRESDVRDALTWLIRAHQAAG